MSLREIMQAAAINAVRMYAERGLSQGEIARELDCCAATVARYARPASVVFKRGPRLDETASRNRDEAMAELYREGKSFANIGGIYGMSGERVRQILTGKLGITSKDGGHYVVVARRRDAKRAAKDARCLAEHGLTFAQLQEVRRTGRELMKQGVGRERTPRGAFSRQRQSARRDGNGWELNFAQWWGIWSQSGHWEQRGRGKGYWMQRRDTAGPYSVDNVFIARGTTKRGPNSKRTHHTTPSQEATA